LDGEKEKLPKTKLKKSGGEEELRTQIVLLKNALKIGSSFCVHLS
jgi:hypothetical protein